MPTPGFHPPLCEFSKAVWADIFFSKERKIPRKGRPRSFAIHALSRVSLSSFFIPTLLCLWLLEPPHWKAGFAKEQLAYGCCLQKVFMECWIAMGLLIPFCNNALGLQHYQCLGFPLVSLVEPLTCGTGLTWAGGNWMSCSTGCTDEKEERLKAHPGWEPWCWCLPGTTEALGFLSFQVIAEPLL